MDILGYHLHNPEALFLFALVPVLVAEYVYRMRKRKSTMKFPALGIAKRVRVGARVRFRHIVPLLRLLFAAALFAQLVLQPTLTPR